MIDRLTLELLLVQRAERKDAPPRETPPEPGKPATADDYRRLLVRARRQQLEDTTANLQRLAETYTAAARDIAARIEALPDESQRTEWTQAQFQLLRDIDARLIALQRDYAGLLDVSRLDSAQAAANREREIGALVAAPVDVTLFPDLSRTVTLSDGAELTASFGRLAREAVDALTTRYYRDGLRLSDRLYQLDRAARTVIEDTLVQGVTEGLSARNLAARMRDNLAAAGASNPRYQAMRIARTEINNAHREATVRAAIDPVTGAARSYLQGVRWNLSGSHPAADICDVWAAHDEGLGPGVYSPGTTPVDHPNGLCYLTPELVAFPGVGGPGKAPDVNAVSRTQVAYYAAQGDPAAVAAQAAGVGV